MTRVSPRQYATAAALGLTFGAAICWAAATFVCGWSWVTLALAYLAGLLVGKLIQRASGNKLSRRLASVTLASLALGMAGYWGWSMSNFSPPGVYLYSAQASLPVMAPLWLHHGLTLAGAWHGFFQGVRFLR